MRSRAGQLFAATAALLLACGPADPETDGGDGNLRDAAAAADAGASDAGPEPTDAGAPDAGSADAGASDAGPERIDGGAPDAGSTDVDAGASDAGAADGGPSDAGLPDAGCAASETECDGLDDDCDGEIDESLIPPACPLTIGVCALASPTCGEISAGVTGWSACDYGPAYEADESTCDGFDNDCDGTADEGCGCPSGSTCGSPFMTRHATSGADLDTNLEPHAIELAAGGGYIVAGQHQGAGYDGYLHRMAADGTTLWARRVGGARVDILRDVEPLEDGGFVAVGSTNDADGGSPRFDGYVVRVGSDGSVVWARRLDGGADDDLYGLERTANGVVVVGQSTSFDAGTYRDDILVAELDLAGSLLWARAIGYGGLKWDDGRDVLVLPSGELVLFAQSNGWSTGIQNDALVIRTSADASAILGAHRIGFYDMNAARVRRAADGDLILSGTSFGYSGDSGGMFLARFDPVAGSLVWNQVQNSSYSAALDATELAGGEVIGGGSNAWAVIASVSASGATTAVSVYRPLAPAGRNEVRGLTAIADGGYAAVVLDGSHREWLLVGAADGTSNASCARDDGWWTLDGSGRTVTSETLRLRTVSPTLTDFPAHTEGALDLGATAVCGP